MVLGPGIWYKEVKISGFSEKMIIYNNKIIFDFVKHYEGVILLCS